MLFTATAVASALAVSAEVATVVAFTLNTAFSLAASMALSYAVRAISGTPKQQTDNFGVQGKLSGGGAVPRSFGLGLHCTAGSLVYANTHGAGYDTPNAFLTQVIALSDLPGERLVGMWVNGQRVTISNADAIYTAATGLGYEVPEYVRPHNGEGSPTPHLWVKFYDGTQTSADAFMISNVSSIERPYTADHVGKGVCYAIIHAFNDENLWSGFPAFKFELSGVPLYDPSQDSSVGGSGSHRYNDPATWGGDGDDLPAVHAYNILRGFSYGGIWLYGLQNSSAARLPVTNWIAQINKCRATIAGAGGPEPTYRSGGQINVDAQAANALETELTACQGRISEIGGFYKIHVGAPDSPSFSFSDDDILSTETQVYRPFFSLADSVNGIQARYPDPAQGWNYDTAPPYYRTDLEVRDGNRRLMANPQFDFVPYPEQVQRLQKSAIEEAQRARTHTITLPPAFWIVEPGDVGEWTSARNGYSAKQFRVDSSVDKANLDATLNLTEVDPSDFDWNTGSEFTPVVGGATTSNPPPAQGVTSWDAVGYTLLDDTGMARRPAILISWDGAQPGIAGVQFEVRLASNGSSVTRGSTRRVTAGNLIITQSILPNMAYQVRGQYIPSTPRDMLWSAWLNVTTPDIRLSLAEFEAAIKAQVTAIQDRLQDQINEALQRIAAMSAELSARGWIDKREVRSDLFAVAGDATARIASLETVVADDEAAFAAYQTEVSATFGPSFSTVNTVSNAIATLDGYAAASYGVTLNVSGYATGFELVNGGAGFSSFTVVADKFQIQLPGYNGGAPMSVFTVGTIGGTPAVGISGNLFLDGTLNASAIVAGSINTAQLAVNSVDINQIIAGAVTNTQMFATTAGFGSNGFPLTLFSQSVTIKSGQATVTLCAAWDLSAATTATAHIDLYVDGSLVKTFGWNYFLQGSSYLLFNPFVVQWTVTGLSSGAHTFMMKERCDGGSGSGILAGQVYITDFRR